MLHKMSILRHKSQLPSLPRSLLFPIGCSLVVLLADWHKYVQPIGGTLSSPPLSLCSCVGKLTKELTIYEIRCGYSQLQHRVPYPRFLSEYSLCTLCLISEYSLCTLSLISEYSLCTLCLISEYSLFTLCLISEYTLCPLCLNSEYSPCTLCLFSEYSLCTLFNVRELYSLHVYRMLAGWCESGN